MAESAFLNRNAVVFSWVVKSPCHLTKLHFIDTSFQKRSFLLDSSIKSKTTTYLHENLNW